ncbi:MAG: helix-turn-helix transcriptional regulator [Oscillibacter sp.]|nr:helix-turn-helix transcriptional regulator [Oscillibacter sp.]
MPIICDKLFIMLKEKGISSYQVQKTSLLGRATEAAMKHYTGGPDYKVLCWLCETLRCQPGDLMEWIPDEPTANSEKSSSNDAAVSK